MARFNIDLSVSGDTYYDSHGAVITGTAIGEIKMDVNFTTNTVVADVVYYVSLAARNSGGLPTSILYLSGSDILKAKNRFQITVANNNVFAAATMLQAITFIKDQVETVFGVGSTTIV